MNRQIDYINAVRLATSQNYQDRIPQATKENLASIQNEILNNDELQNEFLSILVNKIALTKIIDKVYNNPLSIFKKEMVEYGTTVEEIATDILNSSVFDADDTAVFAVSKPDVECMFHIQNVQLKYKVSISYEQLKGAFRSSEGLQRLTQSIINQLTNGDEYDEYLMLKELLKDADCFDVNIAELDGTQATTLNLIRAINDYIGKLQFMSRLYNEVGIATFSRLEDLRLVIRQDAKLDIDMEVLAKMFNKDLKTFEAETLVVDDFNGDDFTYAMIVDKDLIQDYDTLKLVKDIENPANLTHNYWKHHWSIKSRSRFVNAVRIRKSIAITSFTINKSVAELSIGSKSETQLKVATVTPANASYTEVNWTSAVPTKVKVDENGVCKATGVGSVNDTVIITATNKNNSSKTATCTITLKA